MARGFIRVTAGTNNQIVARVAEQKALSVRVSAAAPDTATETDESGRKWVLAGTPITGDVQEIERVTPFEVATVADDASNATGVLIHDVDITDGDANGGMITDTYVNIMHMDEKIQTNFYATKEHIDALPDITFIRNYPHSGVHATIADTE